MRKNPYFSSVDGVLYNKDKTVLLQYPAMKKGTVKFESTMTEIGGGTFYECNGITSVVIPEGVMTVPDRAFIFSSITSIVLPKSLTTIEREAFRSCENLQSVIFPKKLTRIESGAFFSCRNLRDVVFPEGLTHIANSAFLDCRKMTSVELPKGLIEIGSMALGYFDLSTFDTIYYKCNPDFVVYGWEDTVAENYATGAGLEIYEKPTFSFVPLDYFSNPDHPAVRGDMNTDRSCSSVDALLVLKIIVGKYPCHKSQISAADVDEDGKITAVDALVILKIVVGKEPTEEKFVTSDDSVNVWREPYIIKVGIKKKYSQVNKIWTAKDFPQLKDGILGARIERIQDLTWADTPEEVEAYQNDPEFRQLLEIHLTDHDMYGAREDIRVLSQNGYLAFAGTYPVSVSD